MNPTTLDDATATVGPGVADATDGRAPGSAWVRVCSLERILPDTAVAALVCGRQVAIFRLSDGRVLAIDNHDPCSKANVLARGIVGDVDGEPFVASPIYKQRFSLTTGDGLDGQPRIATHRVRLRDGGVEVATPPGG